MVQDFTASISVYASLDKDVSTALGQEARDVLSLKICLNMCSMILEIPDYPLTLHTYMLIHTWTKLGTE